MNPRADPKIIGYRFLPAFSLGSSFDVLAVRALVSLHVVELAFRVAAMPDETLQRVVLEAVAR